jgi:hypothetical protein
MGIAKWEAERQFSRVDSRIRYRTRRLAELKARDLMRPEARAADRLLREYLRAAFSLSHQAPAIAARVWRTTTRTGRAAGATGIWGL